MEDDYSKVVVGDRVEDSAETTPMMATGIPVAQSPALLEAQAEQPYYGPAGSSYGAPPPPASYGYGPGPGPKPGPEPGELCATVGCLFSWIPLIGILNFVFNTDAPPQSRRQWLAQMSCFIAGSILFINFVFWISWTTTRRGDDDDNQIK
jgi:hypothetical protein